jgi:DNA-binding response OmpR family regulator
MTNAKRVLIADDDEGVVDALARRCQALDLRVERAYDGISALTKIDSLEPDFVILDVNMPCGSGLSVCEMVARDAQLKSIPIIVLTGRNDNETIAACSRLDATYVLKGPSIWSQIEPLLYERLGIDRPMPPEAKQPAEHGSPSLRVGTETEPAAQAHCIQNRYIASLFAALGWPEPTRETPTDHDSGAGPITRPWVLLVDDDADLAATLKLRLEQHGVDLLHAFAGMEGYRFAITHEAQAIILDQELPNGKGEYILRRLKECPATEAIPVIVLTGTKDQALARRMYNLGAVRFLTKPVDWDKLWNELQPLIDREAKPDALAQAALN